MVCLCRKTAETGGNVVSSGESAEKSSETGEVEPASDPKKIVDEGELEKYLAQGWDVQTVLPSGRILIRRVV